MEEQKINDDTKNFRSTLAQVLATLSFSVLAINCGFILVMPTIVIGALRGDDSPLGFTEEQASWFGGLVYIIQPLGSVMSAFLQDVLGRRTCLQLINIPQLVAWIIIYFSTTPAHLFFAVFLMGVSIGFLEAPILSYIGEITQPRLRGVLSGFSGLFYNAGMMIESFLGATVPWRTMVLISAVGPLIGLVTMSVVPESPAWLVTKGRVRDAEKAYQWLRGWVRPEKIQGELNVIVTYVRETQSGKQTAEYKAVPTNEEGGAVVGEKKSMLQVVLEPDVLRAFRIILLYFLVTACVSLSAIRPFFIEILSGLSLPLTPHVIVAICGCLQMLGAVSMCFLMKPLGKRGVSFLSLSLSIFCCFGLGIYFQLNLDVPWAPVILFCTSYYAASLGIITLPWILIIELFPLRARGIAGGLSGALGYSLMFVVIKTYYRLAALIKISGVCFVYGAVGVFGLIYLYLVMPETEGVSLETVERRLRERSSKKKSGRA